MKRKTVMLLGAFFVAGFLFRLWFAGLVPQPFVYDQEEYYGYALGILNKGLHADLYRLYGYPLIITPLIAVFGITSPLPWTVFHAMIDTTTALLVFWIGKKMFRKTLPAWIAFILYLFNPYTTGYVGVLLSEVVTIFFVMLISAFILRFVENRSLMTLGVVSFLLGYLPQVRPVFIILALVLFCGLVWRRTVRVKIAALILFSVPFWYTVAGNIVYFRQFSVLGVEQTFVRELYTSLYIRRGMPFTDEKWGDWPVEAQQAWGAFTAPKDAAGRKKVADRYLAAATDIIRRDPAGFVRSRIAKMGYVWEKHYVYPYVMDNPAPIVKAFTYWGNIVLLMMAAVGIIHAIGRHKRVLYAVLGLFLYISVAHMVSTSEERFSLPAYPWVMVYAGYGIWRLLQRFRGSLLS